VVPATARVSEQRHTHTGAKHAYLSSRSLASLTLKARYSEPPWSGWLMIISLRCAALILSTLALCLRGGTPSASPSCHARSLALTRT